MSDVFISYARSIEAEARRVAEALRAAGYGVWRDDELPAHRSFAEVIEERLEAAKAVVVVWSTEAVRSEWVQSEADRARQDRKLVQLSIDGAPLPMPFDRIQCADLAGWTGDVTAPGWRKVADSVAALARVPSFAMAATGATQATSATGAAPSEPLLAVLAFDNLSGDPEMAYFSDGVSEEIQQTVARGADLKVIGRASSFQFRGADKAAGRVAQALNATHVLDGSVRRAGARVRIAAQLVECRTETSLWSDRYDRDLTDIFALQDEIAAAVAGALKTAFARSAPPPPIDPVAFDLFLRAQRLSYTIFEEQRRRLEMLETVVARAPAFARGWAALAFTRSLSLMVRREASAAAGVSVAQARHAAETALRLDPHMGLAYQALAFAEPWAAYEVREALHEKALAASPNDVVARANFGYFCGAVGRVQQALAVAREAYDLDPLSPDAAIRLGVQLLTSGQLDEAGRVTDGGLERWPDNAVLAHNAMMFASMRKDPARVEAVAQAFGTPERETQKWIRVARALAAGDPELIAAMLEEKKEELARTGTVILDLPYLYDFDFRDEAFELLDKAAFPQLFRDGASPFGMINPGFIFDANYAIYRDPRFPRFCAKLGLAAYWTQTGRWPDCADDVAYDFRAEVRRLTGQAEM